jgi:nicotinamide-nucleotide amidase
MNYVPSVFMLYGVSETAVNSYIKNNALNLVVSVENYYSAIAVKFNFENLSTDKQAQILGDFSREFSKFIYADKVCLIAEALLEICKLRNVTIKVAESFTGGRVASEIVKISGASEVFDEGIVSYSNDAKVKRLGVKPLTLKNYGAVSSQVAVEMCNGLLTSDNVLAISTTGIAGPNSDNTKKPVGLCYIAVGSQSKITAYKHNFTGSREDITEKGKNVALFHAVMALRSGEYDL